MKFTPATTQYLNIEKTSDGSLLFKAPGKEPLVYTGSGSDGQRNNLVYCSSFLGKDIKTFNIMEYATLSRYDGKPAAIGDLVIDGAGTTGFLGQISGGTCAISTLTNSGNYKAGKGITIDDKNKISFDFDKLGGLGIDGGGTQNKIFVKVDDGAGLGYNTAGAITLTNNLNNTNISSTTLNTTIGGVQLVNRSALTRTDSNEAAISRAGDLVIDNAGTIGYIVSFQTNLATVKTLSVPGTSTGLTILTQDINSSSGKFDLNPQTTLSTYTNDSENYLKYCKDTKQLSLNLNLWISTPTTVNYDGVPFGVISFNGLKLTGLTTNLNASVWDATTSTYKVLGAFLAISRSGSNSYLDLSFVDTTPLLGKSGQDIRINITYNGYVEDIE